MENTELCRLCATEKDTFVDGFVRIYSDEGQKFGLEKKIVRCLQIELCPADALPKSVCLECCSKLHQCADFVESSARAQSRLQNLVGNNTKPKASCVEPMKEVQQDGREGAPDSSHVLLKNGEEAEDCPQKYLECVVNEDTPKNQTAQKEQELVSEVPRSRASKRKCRLPVRVSIQHGLEDEITDIDNVDIDAAEISRIFADDDYEDEMRRKRKGRKKRNTTKVTRKKPVKSRVKKESEKEEFNEDSNLHESDDNDDIHILTEGENGSRIDEDFEDEGGDDFYDDDNFGDAKPKSKGRSKKKKTDKVEFKDYQWMCSDCSEEMSSIEELRNHHTEVHKQTVKYMCNTCSKVFTNYFGFVTHYRRHKNTGKFCCETCGKCFSNRKSLESHRTIHSDKKPHVCTVCGKAFRQQSALYVHSRCHLPEELKNKYACDECDKRFSTKPNLVTHKRIHTGIRNYTCDQCGKSFVQKGNLDAHLLTHTTAKPFSCQVCSKSFKTDLQLRKHGSVHTGIKPHQCDICGRQFRERGTLREHHRIHTGAMPFSCEFCGKSFRFKGVLTTHRRQHTGERPYSCLECQHHFTNWPNYNKHMKRRHGINTSRQSRTTQSENAQDQPTSQDVSEPQTPQQTGLPPHPLQLQQQPPPPQPHTQPQTQQQPQVAHGASSLSLSSLCETQMQPQPTALVHKVNLETHQPLHVYHHDNTMSQHSLHSQEDDSMSSHHDMYSSHSVHSPHPAHTGHSAHHAANHSGHSAHAHTGHSEDDREIRYSSEREILLGQMVRDRDRPHFYNPAPGSSVNTNPYLHQSLHQSLHHSLQQSQLPIPGLYGLPQLSLDPSHLEMLHSSAAQHR